MEDIEGPGLGGPEGDLGPLGDPEGGLGPLGDPEGGLGLLGGPEGDPAVGEAMPVGEEVEVVGADPDFEGEDVVDRR